MFHFQPSNVWFDREAIDIDAKECQTSLSTVYESVTDLIKTEMDQGLPANRIIVGKLNKTFCISPGKINKKIYAFLLRWFLNGRCIKSACSLPHQS